MKKRARRLRNDAGSGLAFAVALLPYIVGAAVAFYLYEKLAGAANPDAFNTGSGVSNDTSAASTLGNLVTAPSQEIDTLGTDLSQSASGLWGLITNEATSLENGFGQATGL